MRFQKLTLFVSVFLACSFVVAQPTVQPVNIVITPNHDNWEYAMGEPSTFTIQVLKFGVPQKNVMVHYQIGPERMKPIKEDSVLLKDGRFTTSGIAMKEPGFLRCVATAMVDGKQYRNLTTTGYDISKIQPVVTKPADFDAFWKSTTAELAKLPLDTKMTLLPERSSAKTNVYHVNCQGYGGSRIYGILCIPKATGRKYPAVLQVPGAGVRAYGPDLELADQGVIVLTIGIHGISVILDPSVYADLVVGGLKSYFTSNMDDRDKYYYKRVYANTIRSNDLIFSLPEFDGRSLAVSGGSQGGALSIITASLDKRVKYLAAMYPALCDLTGYAANRAGGWPHMLSANNVANTSNPKVINTLAYYDVVNFAKGINIEGYYTWGFNDETCPPTSMYASYNVISAPKELYLALETGHWTFPEQNEKAYGWLFSRLKP